MRRFTIRLAIAAFTFIIGHALASLWISSPYQPVAVIKSQGLLLKFEFEKQAETALLPSQSNKSIKLRELYTDDALLVYEGVEVTRSYDAEAQTSIVTIKKGEKILARHEMDKSTFQRDPSFFALATLFDGKTKQLIVGQHSGGAHCCWNYWIYELSPQVRLIFDGTRWDIGDGFDELELKNLDDDADLEFAQKIMTFDYFDGMCYAESPEPKIIFKYDRRKKKYLPANHRMLSVSLKGIEDKMKEISREAERSETVKDDSPVGFNNYKWRMYDVILSYIYAGKEKEAWEFHSRTPSFKLNDEHRIKVINKRLMKQELKSDPVYRFIYRR